MEEYRTILQESDTLFTERHSRFIGRAKPVRSEEEATAFLRGIRTDLWDANHHVYAYSIREGQARRFSDDGEPQGTAGMPVLDVLQKSGVTDAVIVVTRYFGGVLLGAGGVVRADSHSASLALEQAGIITMKPCITAELTCGYGEYGKVAALIPDEGGTVDHSEFLGSVTVRFHMSRPNLSSFEAALADVTRGRSSVQVTGEKYFRK
jgi:uncharacterized YigZ family protein